ncbi:hypothetical protein RY27_00805, partial [Litorilinea aerophila]
DERAGVKFNDADLLGIPIRLTVGARGLAEGLVELKLRRNGETRPVAVEELVPAVQEAIQAERARIEATLTQEVLDIQPGR